MVTEMQRALSELTVDSFNPQENVYPGFVPVKCCHVSKVPRKYSNPTEIREALKIPFEEQTGTTKIEVFNRADKQILKKEPPLPQQPTKLVFV